MPFPEVERVIYTTNLIDEVICQFRFPPVLRIDSGPPADFQDRIRDRFPLYRVKANVPFISGIPDNLAPMLKCVSFGQTTHVHEFISKDEKWILSLAAESISLRCRQYERWENFKDYFRVPILALEELYRPSFYSRVGLRYRDLICRSKVDLSGVKWDELLQPWITGPYASTLTTEDIERSVHQYIIKLPENNGRVLVNSAMIDQSGEQCCVLDADLFIEQYTELSDAGAKIDFLNRQARYLWRWSIKHRLHLALGPQPLHAP